MTSFKPVANCGQNGLMIISTCYISSLSLLYSRLWKPKICVWEINKRTFLLLLCF